jgi:hypothetical protein
MKKLIFLCALILFVGSAIAQTGYTLTYSPLEYAQMLKEAVSVAKQYQAQLKDLQYTIQSVQNQVKSMKNLKVKDYNSLMRFLNDQAEFTLRIEGKLKNYGVKLNDQTYKLWEINKISEEYQAEAQRIKEDGLTKYEESDVMRWMGMGDALQTLYGRAANYISDVQNGLNNTSNEVADYQKDNASNWEKAIALMGDNPSSVAQMQALMVGLSYLSKDLGMMQSELGMIAKGIGAQTEVLKGDLYDLTESDATRQYVSYSDAYLKYLEQVGKGY